MENSSKYNYSKKWAADQQEDYLFCLNARCLLRNLPSAVTLHGHVEGGNAALAALRVNLLVCVYANGIRDNINFGDAYEFLVGELSSKAPINQMDEIIQCMTFALDTIIQFEDKIYSVSEVREKSVACWILAIHASNPFSLDENIEAELRDPDKRKLAWQAINSDMKQGPSLDTPIWGSDIDASYQKNWTFIRSQDYWSRHSEHWGFWQQWYQGFLSGKPLDWELQRRVALISEATWAAGPEVVANEIGSICAKFDLEKKVEVLERERNALKAEMDRHRSGGNNPPESMYIEAQVVKQTTIIWATVDALKAEIQKEYPNKSVLLQSIATLARSLAAILAWCGRKGDLSVDQIIKWGVPLGGAAILANPKLVSDVIDAIKAWLTFL